MNNKVINEVGQWGAWSAEQKKALSTGKINTQVGEHQVYENDQFTIWSIHLPAGKTLPFHKHNKRYFWTSLSAGISRSFYDDGSITETEYKVGDTRYFPDLNDTNYFIHNLENIGSTTLIFTTVEFFTQHHSNHESI